MSDSKREQLLAGLAHHTTARKQDYEAATTVNNVPLQGAYTVPPSQVDAYLGVVKPKIKERAKAWWISDMNPTSFQYYLPNKLANSRLTKEGKNVEQGMWIRDVCPTTGREHVHLLLWLLQPQNKFQVCALLKITVTEKNCLPCSYFQDVWNRHKYLKDKNVVIWTLYKDVLPSRLPMDRDRRDPTREYQRAPRGYVSSASAEDTESDSEVLDLRFHDVDIDGVISD